MRHSGRLLLARSTWPVCLSSDGLVLSVNVSSSGSRMLSGRPSGPVACSAERRTAAWSDSSTALGSAEGWTGQTSNGRPGTGESKEKERRAMRQEPTRQSRVPLAPRCRLTCRRRSSPRVEYLHRLAGAEVGAGCTSGGAAAAGLLVEQVRHAMSAVRRRLTGVHHPLRQRERTAMRHPTPVERGWAGPGRGCRGRVRVRVREAKTQRKSEAQADQEGGRARVGVHVRRQSMDGHLQCASACAGVVRRCAAGGVRLQNLKLQVRSTSARRTNSRPHIDTGRTENTNTRTVTSRVYEYARQGAWWCRKEGE